MPDLASGDGAVSSERGAVVLRREQSIYDGSVPGAVGAGQPPAGRDADATVRWMRGIAQKHVDVGYVATDERRNGRSAGECRAVQLVDRQVDGAFRGISGRRVTHAEYADQAVNSVAAMVNDRARRFALDAVAAGRHRKQAPMDQAQIRGLQRKPRESPIDVGDERVDLPPVERQPVDGPLVAVIARPDDRELAPRGHEKKPATGLSSHRVRARQG